jgi:hypothetical protein
MKYQWAKEQEQQNLAWGTNKQENKQQNPSIEFKNIELC